MKDVDQLFRDKLNHHEKPYHGNGWDRIEKSLQSERKPFAYWKMAAAIALTLGCTYAFFHFAEYSPSHVAEIPVKTQEKLPSKNQSMKSDTVSNKKEMPSILPKKASPTPEKKSNDNASEKTPPTKGNVQLPMNNSFNSMNTALVTEEHNGLDESDIATETSIAQLDDTKQQTKTSTKIVLTLEDTKRFLATQESSHATSETVSSSTLEMAVAKAKDLKNNQDPLAELRQIKNDILALNFKNKNVDQY